MERDVNLIVDLLLAARQPLHTFLSGFTADGGCSEGPGYWAYGFGMFCLLNEQLETRTGGAFSLLENMPNVQAIAQYGPAMSLMGPRLVNFSDCDPGRHILSPSLLTYLGSRLNNDACRRQAAVNVHYLMEHPQEAAGHRNELLRLFLKAPESVPSETPPPMGSAYWPDLAVVVSRHADGHGRIWEFAVKGGHNAEHHNHNDCGSFLLHVDGVPLIGELGAPEYVKEYFGPDRYDFFAAGSMGHSVPLVNQQDQKAGRTFAAKVVDYQETANGCIVTLDLAGAYDATAGIKTLRRVIRFDPAACGLEIHESWNIEPFEILEYAIIAPGPADIDVTEFTLSSEKLVMKIAAVGAGCVHSMEHHFYRNHAGQGESANRLVFLATQAAGEMTINCRLRPRPQRRSRSAIRSNLA